MKTILRTGINVNADEGRLAAQVTLGGLTRYINNGRIGINNNAAGRSIRGIDLGRKNYLFAGSDKGGNRAAATYSLIETCKLGAIDPEAYLRDILAQNPDHKINRIDQLLPWNWLEIIIKAKPRNTPDGYTSSAFSPMLAIVATRHLTPTSSASSPKARSVVLPAASKN